MSYDFEIFTQGINLSVLLLLEQRSIYTELTMQLLVIKLLMSNPNMISSILYIIHIFPMQIPEAIHYTN